MTKIQATAAEDSRRHRSNGWVPLVVFAFVLAAQLFLVAGIGTDIPYQDQWDAEGRLLYPAWRDGTLQAAQLVGAHNEHRIFWTRLLDLALVSANGQWDPLVQLAADAVLHAAGAAVLAWLLARGMRTRGRVMVGVGIGLAYLPLVAWQNALWGFQSQVYFVMLFSVASLALLGDPQRSHFKLIAGLAAGIAALFAMGAGAFVPVALLGLAGLRAIERRRCDVAFLREVSPALGLLVLAWLLRADVPAHAVLRATTASQYFNALGRALAWPHTWMPAAAVVLNLPLLLTVTGRLSGQRRPAAGEDFVLLIGGWAVLAAGAMAWSRGGGSEFDAGVPSRYVDFLVLLPIANVGCALELTRATDQRRRRFSQLLAGAWGLFLLVGWLGLSAQVGRGLILPRLRDRDAPVRLAVAFQQSGDSAVFTGQPRLLIPHPNLESVRTVLNDPRMKGALPPSFQPDEPMGPLSRAARWILRRQGTRP